MAMIALMAAYYPMSSSWAKCALKMEYITVNISVLCLVIRQPVFLS